MAIIYKTKKEIEILREGGRRLGAILVKVGEKVKPGVTTAELDAYAEKLILAGGDIPVFKNYKPHGAPYPYPSALCTSVNSEIVHGIPKKDVVLKEGDIVSIDLGLKHKGLINDSARTVPVGKISKKDEKLLNDTLEALTIGIEAAQPGNRVGDIGYAIEKFVNKRYGIVRELSGHGVGKEIHEDPYVPNYGKKGTGAVLKPGMVIAIEPMLNLGTARVIFDKDGYTVRTADGKKSAHFEHTIAITEEGPEVLTFGE